MSVEVVEDGDGDAADGFCVVVGGADSFFGLFSVCGRGGCMRRRLSPSFLPLFFCVTIDRMGLRYWGSREVGGNVLDSCSC